MLNGPVRFLAVATLWALCSFHSSGVIPGHVEAWGNNLFGQSSPPASLDAVVAIAAGSSHSLALRSDGTVAAWGDNSEGQCNVPAGLSNVTAIAARTHSVALKQDGTVVVWGSSHPEVTTVPLSVTNVIGIAAGGIAGRNESFTIAVRKDGTAVVWGLASAAETDVPSDAREIIAASGGPFNVFGLKGDGTVISWGGLGQGGDIPPPPGLSGVVAVRAGQFIGMAVKSDGTLLKWGEPTNSPLPPGLGDVIDIQLGLSQAIALLANGTVRAWGTFSSGSGPEPAFVPAGLESITAISAGDNHFLVLTPRPNVFGVTPPVNAAIGDNVRFEVFAKGSGLSFQWQHNGGDIWGQTNAVLVLTNVQPAAGGIYTVRVSNAYGAVLSSQTALLFPALPHPAITAEPQSVASYRGENVTFKVEVNGVGPFTYQWLKGGLPLPGEMAATLNLTNISIADAGDYSVVITDAASVAVTSSLATLSVLQPSATGHITLLPDIDTSISPASNPQGNTVLVGTRGSGVPDRGLIHFDLSSVPKNTLITAVEVRLTQVRSPRGAAETSFSLHRLLRSWTSAADWSNAAQDVEWAAPGGLAGVDFAAESSSTSSTGDFGPSDSLLNDVAGWFSNPSKNYGWLIKVSDETIGRSARHFGSLETGSPAQLVIDYAVPTGALINIQKNGADLTFQVTGVAGVIYRVEARDELEMTGRWTTVTNVPAGAASQPILFSLPIEGLHRFYRVVAE